MAQLAKSVDDAVFDADNHYYEPLDIFARYIEPSMRARTFVTVEQEGHRIVLFDGRRYGYVTGSGQRKRMRPGSMKAALRGATPETDEDADDSYAAEPGPRLAIMDKQGIAATLMFPSVGVSLENMIGGDVELWLAHVDAFNRWLAETWSFNYEGRIVSPALISLVDPTEAVRQLEFALEHGALAINLQPGPAQWGVSPADDRYDQFWARVNEAGCLVTYHLGDAGYMERYSADWGEDPDPDGIHSSTEEIGRSGWRPADQPGGRSAYQWSMLYRDRPIMETIAILIFHNLFGRFPNVRVASVENGSIWVPYLLHAMDNMKGMARNGPWPGGYVEGRPSEVFKRHIFVSPYHHGEDVGALMDLIGADQVLFGSDFPHGEGMATETDYYERASEFAAKLDRSADDVLKVMRGNGMQLLGLDP